MIAMKPSEIAREVLPAADRPATSILLDTPDLRLVVFRLRPGQSVPPHRSRSSVMLTVLEGAGILSGPAGELACTAGDVVCYAPKETHGMRAISVEFHLLAAITPRPGERVPVAVASAGAA